MIKFNNYANVAQDMNTSGTSLILSIQVQWSISNLKVH